MAKNNRAQSNELVRMIERLHPLTVEHAQLFNARLGSLQGTISLYRQVGKKFTKADLDAAIDAAFANADAAIHKRPG